MRAGRNREVLARFVVSVVVSVAPPDLRPPQLTLTNFARNSPATVSNLECASLELQRFRRLLKVLVIELRATFWELSPIQDAGHRTQETAPGLVLRATGLGSLAQSGSGERNIAPAWCSSSWHDASLKQKPPTRAQNRRELASLGVQGQIMFHGAPNNSRMGVFSFIPVLSVATGFINCRRIGGVKVGGLMTGFACR